MNYPIIIFSFVIGFSAILVSWKLVALYFKIGGWKKIDAKIISREVVFNNLLKSPRTPYTILIEYVYNYNGTQYNGNKLDLVELIGGYSSYSKEDAENRMKEIKDNEVIFLNPKEPKQTVMNRKGVTLYMVVFLMGILAVLFGVLKILDN